MNRTKRKNKKRASKAPAVAARPLSDQYIQKGDRLLDSIGDGFHDPDRRAQSSQTLDEAIDSILQGAYLFDIETANHARAMGRLSEADHQAEVDKALDRFNNPAGEAKPASIGRTHLYSENGELLYLGD